MRTCDKPNGQRDATGMFIQIFLPLLDQMPRLLQGVILPVHQFLLLQQVFVVQRGLLNSFLIYIVLPVGALGRLGTIAVGVLALPTVRFGYTVGPALPALVLHLMLLDAFLVVLDDLLEVHLCLVFLRSLIQVFTLLYLLQHQLQLLLDLQCKLVPLALSQRPLRRQFRPDVVVGVGGLLEEGQDGGVFSFLCLASHLRTRGVVVHPRQSEIWLLALRGQHLLVVELRHRFRLAHRNKYYYFIPQSRLSSKSLLPTLPPLFLIKYCTTIEAFLVFFDTSPYPMQTSFFHSISSLIIGALATSLLLSQFPNTEQFCNMFQSFLTAVDGSEASWRQRKAEGSAGCEGQAKLREAIRGMVVSLMPFRELCTQAVVNVGLPASVVDFEKVLKSAASEANLSTLAFTCMQLATLQKQCAKLKKTITLPTPAKQPTRTDTRTNTRKETLLRAVEEPSKKQSDSGEKLRRAVEEEMAFRIKVKNMNSREKVEKKQEILKKRAEKAKSMNKRALKVYKNYKQKEEQSYDFFKTSTINTDHANTLDMPNVQKRLTAALKQSPHSSREKSCDLKVSILRSSYNIPSEKSKTAATRVRIRYNEPTLDPSSFLTRTSNDRFAEYKKREAATRSKKEGIERSKEEQALFRLIKKNERLTDLEQRHQQQQEKQTKKLQKMHQDSFAKAAPELLEDLEVGREKCEGQLRKQMQLQEQVNRIRDELRAKEQRRERHRLRREREHEQGMTLNEQYLRSYATRCRTVKQGDQRHEMTIRRRHQLLQEKENEERVIQNLSKLTDEELLKSIERLNAAEGKASF